MGSMGPAKEHPLSQAPGGVPLTAGLKGRWLSW